MGDSVQLGNSRLIGDIVVAASTTAKLQEKVDVKNQVVELLG